MGNSHGPWSSQLKHIFIGKYVRIITRAHASIIVVRVKDCGYIKMSELSEDDLASEGLSRNLSSDQKRVLLRLMLFHFDDTSTYDDHVIRV